jgi:hypothetical protein
MIIIAPWWVYVLTLPGLCGAAALHVWLIWRYDWHRGGKGETFRQWLGDQWRQARER